MCLTSPPLAPFSLLAYTSITLRVLRRWLEEARCDVLPNLPNALPAKDCELLRSFDYEAAIAWLECVASPSPSYYILCVPYICSTVEAYS